MRHDLGCDAVGVHGETRQQRPIANQIDQPRNAVRQPVDELECLRRERDCRRSAGNRQPVRDVGSDGFPIERLQLVANRHALIELPQSGRPQQGSQVQLADENDLEQLLLVGFEVRQDADLLEHLQRQILRLVDDEHGAGIQRDETEKEVVERVD